jgi:hypothetical protein
MKAHTAFRLDVRKNGYWPLLNKCKRPVDDNWQRRRPDEAEILSWDRSAFTSTGLKLDGDLAVIDVDVPDAGLVEALASAMNKEYPALLRTGLVRHTTKGPKEAWIVRVKQPFRCVRSKRWYRDPSDKAAPKHMVECYGSLGTRQFGIDGPHTCERSEIVSVYQFAGGRSPATVPRSSLPVLPKAAFARARDLFNEIAQAAGLKIREKERDHGDARRVYDLTDDMVFENESCSYKLNELEDAYFAAKHEGHDLRVTSSFLGHGTNPTKCIVGYSHRSRCICVHDFEADVTHLPASRAPPTVFKFFERIRKGANQ